MSQPSKSKTPLRDIRSRFQTCADRSAKGVEIMDGVIAENGDPEEAQLAGESAAAHLKEGLRLIRVYHPS